LLLRVFCNTDTLTHI